MSGSSPFTLGDLPATTTLRNQEINRRNYQSGAQKGKKYRNSIVGRFVISLYFGQMQASCFPLLPVFMLS